MNIMTRLTTLFARRQTREDYQQRGFVLEALPQHSTGAEIGVHEGDFTRLLLAQVKPDTLHLIDPWEYRTEPEYSQSFYGGARGVDQRAMDRRYNRVLMHLHKYLDSGQAIIHRQRSAMACESFPAQYFDWIYIDGDHLYEQVSQDLVEYGKRVKTGGLIAGGGYRSGAWWGDGVVKAVNDFVASNAHSEFIVHGDQFLIRLTAD